MLTLKHFGALSLMAAAVLTVSACNDDSAKPVATAQASEATTATTAPAVTDKSSFDEKVAYAVGASVGGYISQMVTEQGEYLGHLDYKLIEQGFVDALNSKSAMQPQEIESTLQALDQKVQEQMAAQMKAQAEANLKAGEDFLAQNAKKEGVVTTASGLQYKVVKSGNGKAPKATDTVVVKYKGTTIDGKVFDEQKDAVTFPLQNMIAGWVEGLQLMQEGAVYELYIPAKLAYGENGAGNLIQPNSALVFTVELVQVKSAENTHNAATEAAATEGK